MSITADAAGVNWIMPDCLYTSPVTAIVSSYMIYQGDSSYPDPIERLGASLSGLTSLSASYASFILSSGSTYIADWNAIFTSLTSIQTLELSHMKLQGSLPSSFPPTLSSISLDNNQLTGTIPASLFASIPTTASTFYFLANANPGLSGSLPNPLFGNTVFNGNLQSVIIFCQACSLTGSLPTSFLPTSALYLNTLVLNFGTNSIDGSIPPNLISDVMSMGIVVSNPLFTIGCEYCHLTGALDLPAATIAYATTPIFQLSFPSNSLNSLSFGTDVATYLRWLDVSSNTALAGQLDNLFASSSSRMTSLKAPRTALSGSMPELSASAVATSLTTISLSQTNIEFCQPSNRQAWTSSSLTCELLQTSAYNCPALYPTSCVSSMPPPSVSSPVTPPVQPPAPIPSSPTVSPTEAPTTEPTPVQTPVSPIPSSPTAPPSSGNCQPSSKPIGGSWGCSGESWTSSGSVDAARLVLPTGTGNITTYINGDLMSQEIIFGGLGNTLVISGCATNLTDVTVQLGDADLDRIGNSELRQLLVSTGQSGPGCADLMKVSVNSDVTGAACKKATTKTEPQSTQLVALFSVSSSGCKGKSNAWWIILVSVVCGVIIIGVVILVLVFTFNQKARLCCRPYEDSNGRYTSS